MKAKKVCALLLASALAVGTVSALAACKKDDNDGEKGGFVEDTRLWYVVGRNTKGTLSKFDNFYPQDTSVAFVRDTEVKEENVFTISLDIYADPAGYGFKFLYKTSADEVIDDSTLWTRQIGIENFADVEGEGEDAVIKNAQGETVFTTKGGLDAHNLYLAKGQEGTYKFTLKTKSDTDKDPVVTWEKTDDIEVTHDMYIRGDINNFGVNKIPMNEVITKVEETEVITWTAQIEVTAKDLWRDATGALKEDEDENGRPVAAGSLAALQVYNDIDKKTYAEITSDEVELPVVTVESFDGDEYKCVLVPEGNYTITYHQADNKITYQQGTHEMYIRGSGEGMSWSEDLADFKLTESNDKTTWTGYLTVKPEEVAEGKTVEIKLHNKLTGDSGWVGDENGNNFVLSEAGTYAIKFTLEGNVAQVEKCEYYLVGTFLDAENNVVNFGDKGIVKDVHPVFVAGEGNMSATFEATDVTGNSAYSWMVDQGKDGVFGVQIVMGSTLLGVKEWGVADSGNNIFVQAGTWTVTVDTANGWTYTVTAAQS